MWESGPREARDFGGVTLRMGHWESRCIFGAHVAGSHIVFENSKKSGHGSSDRWEAVARAVGCASEK